MCYRVWWALCDLGPHMCCESKLPKLKGKESLWAGNRAFFSKRRVLSRQSASCLPSPAKHHGQTQL